ncbi:hypothetical protein KCU93_g472, partial [Aureobasidium melanogenum]
MSFDSCHHFSYPLSPPAMTSLALATRITLSPFRRQQSSTTVEYMVGLPRCASIFIELSPRASSQLLGGVDRFRLKVNLTVALLTRGYL